MGIEDAPVRSEVTDKNGKITKPWRDWFELLIIALNTTSTIDVLISSAPDITKEITYVDGAE